MSEIARALGVSRYALRGVLSERRPVTPEMAQRLGKLCGNGPGLWLRMQVAYDLAVTAPAMAQELKRIPTFKAA